MSNEPKHRMIKYNQTMIRWKCLYLDTIIYCTYTTMNWFNNYTVYLWYEVPLNIPAGRPWIHFSRYTFLEKFKIVNTFSRYMNTV